MKHATRHKGAEGREKKKMANRRLIKGIMALSIFSITFVVMTLPNVIAQNGTIMTEDVQSSIAVEKQEEEELEERKTQEAETTKIVTKVTEQTAETVAVVTNTAVEEANKPAESAKTTEPEKSAEPLAQASEVAELEPEENQMVKSTVTGENDEQEEVAEEPTEPEESSDTEEESNQEYSEYEPVLTASAGRIQGPSGEETYYNKDMQGCIDIMKSKGYDYEYSVREDGVKLYGGYVMVAAYLPMRPKGTLVQTSLGMGIVVDTGDFAATNHYQLDIAVTW